MKNSLPKKSFKYSKLFLAQIAFLIVNLIWGAATPIIKHTLDYIPPLTFLFLRFLIVCVVLLPFTSILLKREQIHKKDYLNFFLLGLFSQTSLAVLFISLKYTTALDATIIGVLGTIASVYAGHYFYKEKINGWVSAGLITASLGTLLIVIEPIMSEASTSMLGITERVFGNILSLLYAFLYLIFIIWSKYSMGERSLMMKKTLNFINIRPMTKKYSPTLLIFSTFYVGLATLLPFAIIENFAQPQNSLAIHANLDLNAVLGLLYMALISSIAAYTLNQWALDNAKVSDSAMYGYLAPVFTLPFAYLLLGEIPNLYMITGVVIITAGVVMAESKNSIPC